MQLFFLVSIKQTLFLCVHFIALLSRLSIFTCDSNLEDQKNVNFNLNWNIRKLFPLDTRIMIRKSRIIMRTNYL